MATRRKNLINNLSIVNRFQKKRTQTKNQKLAKDTAIQAALAHPDNSKAYHQAHRTVVLQTTIINLKKFGKWLLIDLLWLLPPYLSYSMFQQELTRILLTDKISSKVLWGLQEQLLLTAIITGALVIICGNQIIKNGLFHHKTVNEYIKTLGASSFPLTKSDD